MAHKILTIVAKFCTLLLLLPPMIAFGQGASMSVSKSTSRTLGAYTNNIADCATATDCWTDTKGVANSVFYANGQFYSINASCQVWSTVVIGKTNWVQHPEYGCVSAIFADQHGTLFALRQASCNGGPVVPDVLVKWNGSSWGSTIACGPSFSFGSDGNGGTVSFGIGIDNQVDVSINEWQSGGTYEITSGCLDRGGAKQVAYVNSTTFLIVCADNTIWKGVWGGSTSVTYTQLPGAGPQVAVSPHNDWWALGTDGKVYYFQNGTWKQLNQTATYLAADSQGVEIIGPSSKVLRFELSGLQYQFTTTGTFSCLGANHCTGFIHYAKSQATFGGITSQLVTNSVPSTNGTNSVSATVTIIKHAAQDCVDDFANCTPTEPVSDAECSSGVSNDGPTTPTIRKETASTRVQVTPGAPYWDPNYMRFYYSNVVPECSNTSTPDLDPTAAPGFLVSDWDAHDVTMDISSFGISINGAPWFWFAKGRDNALDASPGREFDPGPTYCTVYPN